MNLELKLLMTRLSEFSLSWPSARNELNMTHFICCVLFFSLTIFWSETNIQCPPVFMGNNWTAFGHDGSLLILSLRAISR